MGGRVILVQHNLSIIPLAQHNFEHNTLVSQVMPESTILYFLEHNPTNPTFVILGKKIAEGKKAVKPKKHWYSRKPDVGLLDKYTVIISTGRSLNIGAPPRGWNLEEENN